MPPFPPDSEQDESPDSEQDECGPYLHQSSPPNNSTTGFTDMVSANEI